MCIEFAMAYIIMSIYEFALATKLCGGSFHEVELACYIISGDTPDFVTFRRLSRMFLLNAAPLDLLFSMMINQVGKI